jgi:PPP family 3-phenylpropionic acid transporter
MIYYLAYFFVNATFVIVNPYLQVLLDNLGFGFKAVGVFIACFEGFGILGPLLVGYLANKKNLYKEMVILSLIIGSITFYLLAFAHSYLSVILLITVTGFFFRAVAPGLDSIGNLAVKGDSSKYTKIRAAGTMGYAVVSAILSFIKKPNIDSNTSIGFWFIVICLLSVFTMFFVPKQEPIVINYKKPIKDDGSEDVEDKWYNKGLIIGLIVIGLSRFSLSGTYSFLSLYSIKEVGYTDLTTLNLIATLAEFFVMLYSGYLLQVKKVKPLYLLMLGSLAISVRVLIYAFLPSVKFLLLAQTLHGLCFGAFHPAAIVFINQHVRNDKVGVGISLYYALSTGLPAVLGSTIGGVLVSNYGFKTLFIFYCIIGLVAVFTGIIFHKPLNEKIEH